MSTSTTAVAAPPSAPDDGAPLIPLVDLAPQHAEVSSAILHEVAQVVERGDLVLGEAVGSFERALARHHQVDHAVGTGSGTDAIELALRALGIGEGDEVILPANTFIATAEAVRRAGATVVLADCEPGHHLLDPARVTAALSRRARAVIAVHLYGQAAPVERLRSAAGPGVAIVEDAAQAQGATRNGRSVMALGDVAATSFYPGKNLGAWGDGGAVLTSDAEVAATVRALGNHGSTERYHHPLLGTTSRLDTIQAVVLKVKLAHLARWNAQRRLAADRYHELLGDLEAVRLPGAAAGNGHVWHLYVVRVAAGRRDAVLEHLRAQGIGAGIHYPVPIHLQGAFSDLGHGPGDFPVAESLCREILSLPLFPGITEAQQARVATTLREALR